MITPVIEQSMIDDLIAVAELNLHKNESVVEITIKSGDSIRFVTSKMGMRFLIRSSNHFQLRTIVRNIVDTRESS